MYNPASSNRKSNRLISSYARFYGAKTTSVSKPYVDLNCPWRQNNLSSRVEWKSHMPAGTRVSVSKTWNHLFESHWNRESPSFAKAKRFSLRARGKPSTMVSAGIDSSTPPFHPRFWGLLNSWMLPRTENPRGIGALFISCMHAHAAHIHGCTMSFSQ